MNIRHFLVLSSSLLALSFFAGCNSASNTPAKLTPEMGAETLRDTVSTAAILILRNNPNYLPAVQGVSTALDAFLIGTTNDEITQATIDAFVRSIAERNGVAPADIPLFLNLTRRFTRLYQDTYQVDVIHRLDPGATLWVKAVDSGIADALSAINDAKK